MDGRGEVFGWSDGVLGEIIKGLGRNRCGREFRGMEWVYGVLGRMVG